MSVEVAGLTLANPVLVASGCGGTGRELSPYLGEPGLAGLGAFVTRSLTMNPRTGGRSPRLAETPSGLLWSATMPNPGVDLFLATELPWLLRHGARVVVSIVGATMGEYAELARRLGRSPGVSAIEVNLAAPDPTGVLDVREPFHAAGVVSAVHRDLPRGIPVLAKLRPDLTRLVETARAVVDAGADAVVVGGAHPAAHADGRPAGLSGPAIRPLALRCVTAVHEALPDAAVIGAGGISDLSDARSFLDAGAVALQIGSALLHDPTTAARLAADLTEEHAR